MVNIEGQSRGGPKAAGFEQAEIVPGLVADSRRAIWLAHERLLAVSDLHLGLAWAQRVRGQLLPITAPDDTISRLVALAGDYRPTKLVVLGDVVHVALELAALEEGLRELVGAFSGGPELHFVLGNHDRGLGPLLDRWQLSVRLHRELPAADHVLRHGDDEEGDALDLCAARGRFLIGHEHPAFALDDGVATRVKCPCFLVSDGVVVLPAFSNWAAGTDVRTGRWLGRIARSARFTAAWVCVGPRLLRVPI